MQKLNETKQNDFVQVYIPKTKIDQYLGKDSDQCLLGKSKLIECAKKLSPNLNDYPVTQFKKDCDLIESTGKKKLRGLYVVAGVKELDDVQLNKMYVSYIKENLNNLDRSRENNSLKAKENAIIQENLNVTNNETEDLNALADKNDEEKIYGVVDNVKYIKHLESIPGTVIYYNLGTMKKTYFSTPISNYSKVLNHGIRIKNTISDIQDLIEMYGEM